MRRATIAFAWAVLAALGCGGGDGDNGPTNPQQCSGNPTNGTYTVRINDRLLCAAGAVQVNRGTNNFLGISVSGLTDATTAYTIIIGLGNATGPGTYSLTYLNTAGSSVIVGGATGGWGTFFPGGTGSLVLTTLTTNRVAGTWTADAVPGSGGATGTLRLREGTFDVTF